MCWNRVIVLHRCIAAFKFKTTLVSAFFLLFLLYCILDPSKSEYPVNKRRTLKRYLRNEEKEWRTIAPLTKAPPKLHWGSYSHPRSQTSISWKTWEGQYCCVHQKKWVAILRPFESKLPELKVGSMTFFWAFLTHLDEDDGASWVLGPNKSNR